LSIGRQFDVDKVVARIEIILAGLVDDAHLPVLFSEVVAQTLVELARLECRRVAVVPDADNELVGSAGRMHGWVNQADV